MINFIVIREHTLAYVDDRTPAWAGPLATSTIRGATHHCIDGPILLPPDKSYRAATRRDFKEFRVCSNGYENNSVVDETSPDDLIEVK